MLFKLVADDGFDAVPDDRRAGAAGHHPSRRIDIRRTTTAASLDSLSIIAERLDDRVKSGG